MLKMVSPPASFIRLFWWGVGGGGVEIPSSASGDIIRLERTGF